MCGPVGNCNAVQQSSWAMLLGVPVGTLGQAGYLGIFTAWILAVVGPKRWVDSAWLTFLEPFVIGATCLWCLTSAVLMTLILMGATPRAAALRRPDGP